MNIKITNVEYLEKVEVTVEEAIKVITDAVKNI